MPLISVAIVTVVICFSICCYDNNTCYNSCLFVCYTACQVSSINEVLLIGNYQYDTTLRDFVCDMQREYKIQVRLVADTYIFLFVCNVCIMRTNLWYQQLDWYKCKHDHLLLLCLCVRKIHECSYNI